MATEEALAETSMEARIARLESDVAHLCTDVADIKVDVRSLRDKMDAMYTKLAEKIEGSEKRLDAKIDKLADFLSRAELRTFGLYAALAVAMFGTMARGFGWI